MANVVNPYRRFPTPLVIAHRGGGGLAPENSLEAFENCRQMGGVHALEMDIHMTSDGVLVVAHDETVDRMTEGTGLIKDKTFAEVRALDFGYQWTADDGKTFPFRGQGVVMPTVEEVFGRFSDFIINIDIKQHEPLVVERFVLLIEQYNMQSNMVVGSFDSATVGLFRKLMPAVATCASYREVLSFFTMNKVGLAGLWPHQCVSMQIPEEAGRLKVVTPRFVRNLRSQGVQLHVWTVNDEADMRRLINAGVDGLITDYPDRMLELL